MKNKKLIFSKFVNALFYKKSLSNMLNKSIIKSLVKFCKTLPVSAVKYLGYGIKKYL